MYNSYTEIWADRLKTPLKGIYDYSDAECELGINLEFFSEGMHFPFSGAVGRSEEDDELFFIVAPGDGGELCFVEYYEDELDMHIEDMLCSLYQ